MVQKRTHPGKVVAFMQIVVVKSPRFLSGILRALFGIKKENEP